MNYKYIGGKSKKPLFPKELPIVCSRQTWRLEIEKLFEIAKKIYTTKQRVTFLERLYLILNTSQIYLGDSHPEFLISNFIKVINQVYIFK